MRGAGELTSEGKMDHTIAHDRRGAHRLRRALAASAALVASRGSNFLSMLVLVPVLLAHWGPERFGVWMAVGSVLALLAVSDLGLGHSLVTAVAAASGRVSDDAAHGASDRAALRSLIASGVVATAAVALVIAIPLGLLAWLAPWSRWLGAPDVAPHELREVMLLVLVGTVIGGALGVAGRVQTGLQAGWIAALWNTAATLVTLAIALVALHAGVSFVGVVALFVVTPALVGLANTLWYFVWQAPDLRPAWSAVRVDDVRALFGQGWLFFLLQLAAAVAFFSDALILSVVTGSAAAVPEYAVPARLFAYVSLAVAMLLQPLWPAYAEATARGDGAWVTRTFGRTLALAVAASAAIAAILYLVREPLFAIWTQGRLAPDAHVIAALAVWSVVESAGIAFGMLMNGLQIIRAQVVIAFAVVAIGLPLRIWLLGAVGPWGLAAGTAATYLVVGLLPAAWLVRRRLQRREGLSSPTSTAAR